MIQIAQARAVIVGAGIVGNCMAHHLAKLGWRDLVLIDKGPLPNPGGSTGHASNFIFPTDVGKEETRFTLESIRQFKALGVFTQSGGVEVARTPERMQELARRQSIATAWGIESELITPERVKELLPYVDETIILGGWHTPSAGVVDSLRAGTLMREAAIDMGALTVMAPTEVVGVDVDDGRVARVRTTQGDIATSVLVVACGVWSPRIAAMAGAHIPLVPTVHQMISVGPVPRLAAIPGEIAFPIMRDMDRLMYERPNGSDIEIGSYAHRPILIHPDDIPSIETSRLSPTEMPFTREDFEPQYEAALELIPEVLGDPGVGERYAINGLLSVTPDWNPILGESPEVAGLWSVAAVWIKEAPAIAQCVAQWMTTGLPDIDMHAHDIARFYPHQRTWQHAVTRVAEGFPKFYGIVHPAEQWTSNRNVRLPPMYGREEALGAVFFESAGWEYPMWYASNARLLDEYGDRVTRRDAEWDARWWSPIIAAEHLAMRERAALIDLSAFAIFDVTGPGALAYLEHLSVNRIDVAVGRTVYTPLLDERGRIISDLTIMRLAKDAFRVVTGGGLGMRDKKWFTDRLPADGSAQLADMTSAWTTIGLWGPRARDIFASVTAADVSDGAFPFSTCRPLDVDGISVVANRLSYVGELGWEISCSIEEGARLWDALWEAGQAHGLVAAGLGVATTARLEKGYRAYGAELDLDFTLVEAGLARPTVKAADFIGKAAYLEQRAKPPAAVLCTLTVDDHTSSRGVRRYMLGREPILTRDGRPIADGLGRRSYVTSAGTGPSIGKHLLMSYLPPEHAVEGTGLSVLYLGERYPVTVAAVGATPLFDPANERIRG
ncbi:MAG: glycine cleavage system protein T [Chloroflexi bacterium RBG_16_69_14]|nr:MAG: glycine cleavage system protein T [Chloroflexi bacterium RBG_16_69_14]